MKQSVPCSKSVNLPAFAGMQKALGGIAVFCLLGLSSPVSTATSIHFTDVAKSAGVNFQQAAPITVPVEQVGLINGLGGACAGDFDADGWPDLYVTRAGLPNLLFRNLHDGTFAETAAAAGVALDTASTGCAWADVDNDRDSDLFVLTVAGETVRNYLYINRGDGTFSEEAITRGAALESGFVNHLSTSVSFADIDNDGDLDLFVSAWQVPSTSPEDNLNRLLLNDGSGHFTDITDRMDLPGSFYGFAPGFADVDGDGLVDLLIAADFGTSKYFHNLGGGRFADETAAAGLGGDQNGMGSALADYDNDGDIDWYITAIFDEAFCGEDVVCSWGTTGNRMFINDGHAGFSDATSQWSARDGAWGWGAAAFDFDNDGDLDIAQANGIIFPDKNAEDRFNATPLRLWRNDHGSMTEVGAELGFDDTRSSKGIVAFDFDLDGDQDIYVANNNETPLLLRNDGGNQAHWLRINLHGGDSNRDATGAIVRIWPTGPGSMQMRVQSNNSNYESHNEPTLHFGLGETENVSTMEVTWPATGRIQRFYNVAANQTIDITEPGEAIQLTPPTGLYWDPAHNGHGLDLQKSGDNWFLLFYTYQSDGTPLWYLAVGVMADGVFSGHADRFDYQATRSPPQAVMPGTGGPVSIDFNAVASADAQACNDNQNRIAPAAIFSYSLEGVAGQWCITPFVFGSGSPLTDFTGSWFNENDPGWGLTLYTQGSENNQTLVTVLYFYDADGSPRWALGVLNGFDPSVDSTVSMQQFSGSCPACNDSGQLQPSVAGSISLTLVTPDQSLSVGNTATIDVQYVGAPGGTWVRSNTPIRLLSDPR